MFHVIVVLVWLIVLLARDSQGYRLTISRNSIHSPTKPSFLSQTTLLAKKVEDPDPNASKYWQGEWVSNKFSIFAANPCL